MNVARTALITITSGRDGHLHRQRLGLRSDPPDVHVVVAMGEPPALRVARGAPEPTVVQVPTTLEGLPLAASRNLGAACAIRAGAEVLVFLDVDCIPGRGTIGRYRRAVEMTPAPSLLCGPVGYLPPAPAGGYPVHGLDRLAPLHPARPTPARGDMLPETRFELFWSLSFAVSSSTWTALAGFHEGYVGYGAEDTDFALAAAARGATFYWVGGAEAYHQHHEPSRDQHRHIVELVNNANLFHRRNGSWPMSAWLAALVERGVVDFDPAEAVFRCRP